MYSSRLMMPGFSAFALALLGCSASPDTVRESDGTGGSAVSTAQGGASSTGGAAQAGATTSAGSGGLPGSGGMQNAAGTAGVSASAGSGGSAGGAGGPPHVVGDCAGLGAIDEWQNITPAAVDAGSEYGTVAVLADPINAGTIYVGTDHRGVFKSSDCGANWVKINTGSYAQVLDSGIEWEMKIDPINPELLYAGSLYGGDPSLLGSTNGGVDWASLWPEGSTVANNVAYNFLQELAVDPTDHEHLVVSFHAECKNEYAPMCMGESTDSGASWRLFKGPTNGWVENSRPLVINQTTWLYATGIDGLFYTGDSGQTWERVGDGGGDFYQAQDGTYYLGNYQGVHRSSDGHTWTKIDGSPQAGRIIGDGQRMFTGYYYCCDDKQPIYTASEATGNDWQKLASPQLDHGATGYAYDSDHHLLYVAATKGGLWRFVTR